MKVLVIFTRVFSITVQSEILAPVSNLSLPATSSSIVVDNKIRMPTAGLLPPPGTLWYILVDKVKILNIFA